MLQNALLVAIGVILGCLITMMIENSRTVSYLHKLRKKEFKVKQLEHSIVKVVDENSELISENNRLQTKIGDYKKFIKSCGLPDFDKDW